MSWYHRQAKQPLRSDLKQQLEASLRNDPKKRDKFMDDLSKDIQRMVSKRRIYCLTPDPDSILMWSHYDEHHLGICLEFGVDNPLFAKALQHEIGLEITTEELLATVRRAFIRGLWLERKQGFERSDYTLPSEVFDRPNDKLGLGPFITRDFFSKLSEQVWSVFDKEVAAL